MNQLTQILKQLQALIMGMNPQSRVLAGLMLVSILVGGGFLAQGYSGGTVAMEYLFDGQNFNTEELDQFEVAFSTAALRAYQRNGTRIQVPKGSKDSYLKALKDANAIPLRLGTEMDEFTKGGNILETGLSTQLRYRNTRIKALQNALTTLPFVREALVTYDERTEGFSSDKKKTANVAIYPRGNNQLTESQKQSIISYIQTSFSGLRRSDVALLDMSRAETTVGNEDPEALAHDQYLKTKAFYEQDLKRKALELLAAYGDVEVGVNVELDSTLSEETEELKYNDKPTTLQSTTTKKDVDTQRMNPGGRPGAEPNAMANRSASLTPPDQSSKTKEQSETARSVAGSSVSSIRKVGLKLTSATLSVSVPFSYYQKAYLHSWQMRNPDQQASAAPAPKESDISAIKLETKNAIQAKLEPILDKAAPGEDKFPRIAVTDYIDSPKPTLPEPSLTSQAVDWLADSWQTLALLGLAGVALVSLRSFAKTEPGGGDTAFERGFDIPLDDAADIDLAGLADNEEVDEPVGEDGDSLVLRTTGGDLKQDLTQLVRANPDAAATLLRNWISEG